MGQTGAVMAPVNGPRPTSSRKLAMMGVRRGTARLRLVLAIAAALCTLAASPAYASTTAGHKRCDGVRAAPKARARVRL